MIRSSASASCMSAIGRSKARSSSAWSAHGIGAMSAAAIPGASVGASTPRVRARSRAVSIRSEPSRWRWSSAFGMASTARRRAVPAGGSVAGSFTPPMLPSSHVDHPRDRRQRLRRQPPRARPAGRRPSGRGAGADADGRRDRHRPAAARAARAGRDPDRRRDPPRLARAGDGRRRCGGPPGRDPARPSRRRRPSPGQHRGHPGGHRRDVEGGRQASRAPGRDGRRGRPEPPLRELQGQGRRTRPRLRPRLDDPQAIAPVRPG